MLKEQKEQLSSFMDGEQYDINCVDIILQDKELQQSWHNYHIVGNVMRNNLGDYAFFDISENIAKAINSEQIEELSPIEQTITPAKSLKLFWVKSKDIASKIGQISLAACVTLGIITGVQYNQNSSSNNDIPVLNTVPIGVNISPVGGINTGKSLTNEQLNNDDNDQYNKIRLLVQEYELQKRLHAQ